MKKLLFILLFMPILLFSQELDLLTLNFGVKDYHTGATSMNFNNKEPIVVNIFFHKDANIPISITENDYLRVVAYLNSVYNPFKIFIKYYGHDTTFSNDMANTINVNIMNSTEPQGGALYMGLINISYTAFEINNYSMHIMAHEMGHMFGLVHTFHGTSNREDVFNSPLNCNGDIWIGTFPQNSTGQDGRTPENVTRDSTDTVNYNAHIAGDYVVDTPATYLQPNVCNDYINGTSVYLESDEVFDNSNTNPPTKYVNIDTYNIMSYNEPQYLTNLTPGQGIRMRETMLNESSYDLIKTNVAALYQPYKIITYPMQYFFQPGFDYEFVNCAAGCVVVSSDYDNTSFYYNENHNDNYSFDKEHTPYSDIYQSKNMAVRILQIDDAQPRKCYSVNTKGISGVVVTFNDNIVNTNFYTSTLDSTEVNSSSLIQNLPSGLYIIKKNFEDDRQEQQTILKDDE